MEENLQVLLQDGSLNINGGMLDITGNNRNFSGVFTVNKGLIWLYPRLIIWGQPLLITMAH